MFPKVGSHDTLTCSRKRSLSYSAYQPHRDVVLIMEADSYPRLRGFMESNVDGLGVQPICASVSSH